MRDVLAVILAGGKGTRLEPLTLERAKPAVPFGGCYRIIDFTLSNCINSGLRKVFLLTQYKAASLDRHINEAWRFMSRPLGEFIDVLPPQQRLDEHWYRGTADAVYQNIFTIEQVDCDHILILGGDHIYKMDYSEMVRDHVQHDADVTVACIPVPITEGQRFGVIGCDDRHRVRRFEEKPQHPFPMSDQPGQCLASMGIYVFKRRFLLDQLCEDATDLASSHDFGKNIVPAVIATHKVRAFPFRDRNTKEIAYWRDVGTIDSYYEANMDLVRVDPLLNLYDPGWPIRGYSPPLPPPKFVFADESADPPRVGKALDSLVCPGTILSGGMAERSILSSEVRLNSWSHVEDSILFSRVNVGRHARLRRVIADRGVQIPEGMRIGFDRAVDEARGLLVTEGGLTIVASSNRLAEHR
ncbi:MAG: glucose-1-phosphate adenylyltransferase [Planctomycetaceae bacterium]